MEFLESQVIKDNADDKRFSPARYWALVAEMAIEKSIKLAPIVEAPPTQAFTYAEALIFEQQTVPAQFKKYAGKQVHEVPPSYWLHCTEGIFNKQLLRYVNSERFISVQRLEEVERFSSGNNE